MWKYKSPIKKLPAAKARVGDMQCDLGRKQKVETF